MCTSSTWFSTDNCAYRVQVGGAVYVRFGCAVHVHIEAVFLTAHLEGVV